MPHYQDMAGRGFSILELIVGLVVLLIVGAIGYALYSNSFTQVSERGAQNTLRTLAVAQLGSLRQDGTLVTSFARMQEMEPGHDFVSSETMVSGEEISVGPITQPVGENGVLRGVSMVTAGGDKCVGIFVDETGKTQTFSYLQVNGCRAAGSGLFVGRDSW